MNSNGLETKDGGAARGTFSQATQFWVEGSAFGRSAARTDERELRTAVNAGSYVMAAPLMYCAFAPGKTKAESRVMAAAAGGALLMWGTVALGDAAVREYRYLRYPDSERGRSRWVQWLAGAVNFAAGAIFIFRD